MLPTILLSSGFVTGLTVSSFQNPSVNLNVRAISRSSRDMFMGCQRETAAMSRKGFLIQTLLALQIGACSEGVSPFKSLKLLIRICG